MKNKSLVDAEGRPVRHRTRRGVLIKRMPNTYKGVTTYAKTWTFTKRWLGKLYYFPLSRDLRESGRIADDIDRFLSVRTHTIEEAVERFSPDKLRREQARELKRVATVGELLEAHEHCEKMLELSPETGKEYRRGLASMVRRVSAYRKGKPVDTNNRPWHECPEVIGESTAVFDARYLIDFKQAMLEGAENESEIQTRKATTNSVIRCVTPILAPEAVRLYGLRLPDFSGFLAEKGWRRVHSKKYRLPAESVIRRIVENAGELKASDPNAYLTLMLAFHGGLRAKEIAHAQRSWFDDNGQLWVSHVDDFATKSGKERTVKIEEWAAHEILSASTSPSYILSGNIGERRDRVLRRLNPWLRKQGLDRQKPTHELRQMFGAFIANTRGIYAAQKFLGHSTPQITSDTYSDIFLDDSLKGLWLKGEAVEMSG